MTSEHEIEYVKNEIKSYRFLSDQIEKIKLEFKVKLERIDEKIELIRTNYIVSPQPGATRSSVAVDKETARLINIESLEESKKKTTCKYNTRIKHLEERKRYIESLMKCLTEHERKTIEMLYYTDMSRYDVAMEIGYSRRGLYNYEKKILKKIAKNI